MLKSLIAVSTGLVGGAHGFWRMECPGRVGLARLDPIMSPGEPSEHLHAIHGSSGFSESSGTSDLLAGDCTSCRVTQDKSSYWHPAAFFQDQDTGKFELVPQVGGMLAYYLLYGDNITAFPPNFRMLSGDSRRRNYTVGDPSKPDPEQSSWGLLGQTTQDDLAQRAIGFNCLNYDKTPEGTLYRHYLPDKEFLDANCKDGVRFEKMFPSCWKGGDEVDSPNHQDHVAFPDLVMTGTCPDDYPVRLPSLLYEVIWDTAHFAGRNGRFVIANGDPTGYGYHADFIMGWDEDFLQEAVNTCTNPSGKIEDCPLFDIVDEAKASQCEMTLPAALKKEDVTGPMGMLPGNVEIVNEDGSIDGDEAPKPTTAKPAPTLTYAPGTSATASDSPLPGQIFKETSATVVPTTSSEPNPSSADPAAVGALEIDTDGAVVDSEPVPTSTTTPPPPPPPPETTPSASYYSTQYITNGNVVSEILWEEKLVYVTEMADSTVTVTAPAAPPAQRRRRMAHLQGHKHRHF